MFTVSFANAHVWAKGKGRGAKEWARSRSVTAGEEHNDEDGALQELAAKQEPSHARDVTRHRGGQGGNSAGKGPGKGTGRRRALARSPHVATPRGMCMTTPRARGTMGWLGWLACERIFNLSGL